MSNKHLHTLEAIFQDPIPANLHWHDVESLLHHLGAQIEATHGARLRLLLNGFEGTAHVPHHGGTCPRQDIKLLREFLARAGVSPSRYEARH